MPISRISGRVKPVLDAEFGPRLASPAQSARSQRQVRRACLCGHWHAGKLQLLLSATGRSIKQWRAPGQAYNPLFGVTPVNSLPAPLHRQFAGHRLARIRAHAFLRPGKCRSRIGSFGDNKTVIRAGYAIVDERISDIDQVSLPLTTGGLLDVDACGGPTIGGTCTNSTTTSAHCISDRRGRQQRASPNADRRADSVCAERHGSSALRTAGSKRPRSLRSSGLRPQRRSHRAAGTPGRHDFGNRLHRTLQPQSVSSSIRSMQPTT